MVKRRRYFCKRVHGTIIKKDIRRILLSGDSLQVEDLKQISKLQAICPVLIENMFFAKQTENEKLVRFASMDKNTKEAGKRMGISALSWEEFKAQTKPKPVWKTLPRTIKPAATKTEEKNPVAKQKQPEAVKEKKADASLIEKLSDKRDEFCSAIAEASDATIGHPILLALYTGLTPEESSRVAELLSADFKSLKAYIK